MMRIAVTGSHSTGKSTLISDLAQDLRSGGVRCLVREEPIRQLGPELVKIDQRSAYLRLVQEHFHRLAGEQADCCLYDRCLLDMLAYMKASGLQDPYLENMVFELLKWHSRYFDIIIYLPIEFPATPDPVRPPDEKARIDADDYIRQLAQAADIQLHELRGGIEVRRQAALALARQLIDVNGGQ